MGRDELEGFCKIVSTCVLFSGWLLIIDAEGTQVSMYAAANCFVPRYVLSSIGVHGATLCIETDLLRT
jgi:hypothetical protein